MRTLTLALLLAAGFLPAQVPAAKDAETLEKQASEFEATRLYDPAEKLLTAALSLRGQVSDQSAEYGLCLLKLGNLEHKLIHTQEAADYYARAVQILPGRTEAAGAYFYLGIAGLGSKKSMPQGAQATEYLRTAQSLDVALTGPVLMWTALMYERQFQPEQAEAKYKAALAFEAGDSLDTLETLTLYGRFLEHQGRDAEARTLQARADAIRSAHRSQSPEREFGKGEAYVYRVGSDVSSPSVIYKTDPQYSEEARVAKVSGTVLLQVVIGVDGQASNFNVVKSAGFGLDDCAVAAVAKWRFKPGQKDGSPVPVYATIEVNFRLL